MQVLNVGVAGVCPDLLLCPPYAYLVRISIRYVPGLLQGLQGGLFQTLIGGGPLMPPEISCRILHVSAHGLDVRE